MKKKSYSKKKYWSQSATTLRPNLNRQKKKILIKIILISFLLLGFFYTNSSYSNSITLLAISENSNKNLTHGSTLDLSLKIVPGSGEVFVNLNTLEEIDTQISIINSQKITCKLFKLDCNNYDFYYKFKDSALVLKGPSASSAIAILTTKTLKREKINKEVVITGSLNSGGLIGIVGGIEEKIKVAQKLGYKKVLIPQFSNYNLSSNSTIEIVKVIDLIDAYNNFNSKKYILKTNPINKTEYSKVMQTLSNGLCSRTIKIKNQINFTNIKENTSQNDYKIKAQKTFNSSKEANKIKNYYSQGSFCFNSNINYRILLETQQNYSNQEIENKILKLEKEINHKYKNILSTKYKDKIITQNDFYVYLILNDRIEEAKKLILNAKDKKENKLKIILKNMTQNNSNFKINETLKIIQENNQLKNKINLYSSALERLQTVKLWENFITNSGKKIKFSDKKISESCFKINKEINIKAELLNNYKINFFQKEINQQNNLGKNSANKYLCLYKGLQTIGNINSVLNSVGIKKNIQEEYTKKLLEFTQSRLSLNSNGDFPLIPFIYYEYSSDLLKNKDFTTSILYSNYALIYSDLNLYLEEENTKNYYNIILNKLFENQYFLLGMLILIGFI